MVKAMGGMVIDLGLANIVVQCLGPQRAFQFDIFFCDICLYHSSRHNLSGSLKQFFQGSFQNRAGIHGLHILKGIDSLEALCLSVSQCHQCFHGFLFLLTVNMQAAGSQDSLGSACDDRSEPQLPGILRFAIKPRPTACRRGWDFISKSNTHEHVGR